MFGKTQILRRIFQVQGQEAKVKVMASINGNAKPKVTITYADHLDLEESVMNVSSSCGGGGGFCKESGFGVDEYNAELSSASPPRPSLPKSGKYKNDAKHNSTTKKSFSPMEAIEECSVENSQSCSYEISQPHQYPTSSSNKRY